MMRLSTVICAAVCTVAYLGTTAQTLGIRAGVDVLNITDSDVSLFDEFYSTEIGFRAGIMSEVPVNSRLGVQYGLMLANKKLSVDWTEAGITHEVVYDPFYIDVPLHLKYYITTGNTPFFATLGPTLGIGLFGNAKSKITGAGVDVSEDRSIEWGSASQDDFERFEYALRASLGVRLKMIEIEIGYTQDVNDFAPINDEGRDLKRNIIQLALTYRLPHKTMEEPAEENQ